MAGEKRIRVIVLSDAKNEADDAFAIVHALLTPSFDVRGIIAGHFGVPGSVEGSAHSRGVRSKGGPSPRIVSA